jgi:hypothetical protein
MERKPPRFRPARHGIIVAFLALGLAALLNAQGLRKTAVIQPQGVGRDFALAVTSPLVKVSRFLHFDRPRHELKAALGRGSDDRVDTTIALPAPTPKPAPVVKPVPAPTPVPPGRTHRTRPVPPPPRHPSPPRRAFSPTRPLRVWIGGDSLAEVPGQSLERVVGSGGAVNVLSVESRLSTGLERPDVYNWFTRMPEVIRQLHPNVVVLSFGADDDHDYMTGLPAGHTIGRLGSPTWVAEYQRRAAGVTQQFKAAGVYVVWVGLPITRGEGWNKPFRIINRILWTVAKSAPGSATFIDTYRMFQDERRHYADYLRNGQGQLVLMRSPDGVHYQPPAGDLIARTVLRQLSQVYDLTSWRGRHNAKAPGGKG